jgi:hypothetical protein
MQRGPKEHRPGVLALVVNDHDAPARRNELLQNRPMDAHREVPRVSEVSMLPIAFSPTKLPPAHTKVTILIPRRGVS